MNIEHSVLGFGKVSNILECQGFSVKHYHFGENILQIWCIRWVCDDVCYQCQRNCLASYGVWSYMHNIASSVNIMQNKHASALTLCWMILFIILKTTNAFFSYRQFAYHSINLFITIPKAVSWSLSLPCFSWYSFNNRSLHKIYIFFRHLLLSWIYASSDSNSKMCI